MTNIVVFGPIHSGKSTLMGYIKANCTSKEKRLLIDRSICTELKEKGIKYKPENKYIYYISTDKDEMIPDSSQDSIGTTKRIHIKNISNSWNSDLDADFTFIDTPGINSVITWKDRYEGIFLGDIGIFVVDINAILNIADMEYGSEIYSRSISDLFSSLFLWRASKKLDRVIIVLSKCDTITFEEDIAYAQKTIQDMGYFTSVPIIPVGINFTKDQGLNILPSETIKSWGNQKSFLEKMFEILQTKDLYTQNNSYCFAYIEKPRKTSQTGEAAFRVKILNGILKKGQNLTLLPIKQKHSSELKTASFVVKSLKIEDKDIVNQFETGDIGGIIPVKFTIDGKRCELDEIDLLKTSCIVDDTTSFISGNLLSFRTKIYDSKTYEDNFLKLKINQSINIVWFGKVITATFCSRYKSDGYYHFNVLLKDYPIIMPLDYAGNFWKSKFALEVGNCFFFQAELEAIENMPKDTEKIYLSFKIDATNLSKREIENFLGISLLERDTNYEAWILCKDNKFKELSRTFGSFVSQYSVVEYIFNVIGQQGTSKLDYFDQ